MNKMESMPFIQKGITTVRRTDICRTQMTLTHWITVACVRLYELSRIGKLTESR